MYNQSCTVQVASVSRRHNLPSGLAPVFDVSESRETWLYMVSMWGPSHTTGGMGRKCIASTHGAWQSHGLLGKDQEGHTPAEVLNQVGHSKECIQLDPLLRHFQVFVEFHIVL